MIKPVRFVAYIDESGDTGLQKVRPRTGGASEWLVLSCLLVRSERDTDLPQWVREIKAKFKNDQRSDLHFSDLLPVKKAIACMELAAKPCRLFIVMSNKRNIEGYRNPNIDDANKAWIYWFLTRILLERVTSFCDRRSPESERGQVTLRIIFSRRGGLRYIDFESYLRKLQRQSRAGMLVLNHGDLKWSLIDYEEIRVLNHGERAGLQLADIGAAAFFQAVERNRPADCDPQYAKMLKPIIATKGFGGPLSFGIKTMPSLPEMQISPEQREIFEFYGFNPGGWRAPGG
jgi:hypothetical protein